MPEDNVPSADNNAKAVLIGTSDVPKSMDGETIKTSARYKDVTIKVVSAVWAVFIRALRTFLQAIAAGIVTINTVPLIPGVSDILPPSEFGEKVMYIVYAAGVTALIAAIQRAAEIATKIDDKIPEWTA